MKNFQPQFSNPFRLLIGTVLFAAATCRAAAVNEVVALPPDAAHSSITNDFTLAGWITPQAEIKILPASPKGLSALKGQKFVIWPDAGHERYGKDHSGAGISAGNNGLMVVEHSAFYFSSVLTWEHPVNERTHIAVVYNKGAPELFVNGVSVLTGIASGRTAHPGTVQGGPSTDSFTGTMENWAVYDTALTPVQIQKLCPPLPVEESRHVVWANGSAPAINRTIYSTDPDGTSNDVFATAFMNPPDSTRPSVYWYWLRNNISKEGITKDLEAMKRVGIGGAFIGNVDPTPEGRGSVEMFTDEWWELTTHAVREGTRLGVDIGMFNCPGWSQTGAPWVKPEESMRFLNFSSATVNGSGPVQLKLETPTTFFQDVAVLAFPQQSDPARDLLPSAKVTSTPDSEADRMFDSDEETGCKFPAGAAKKAPFEVTLQYPEPVTVRNISITPKQTPLKIDCELQVKDRSGAYRSIKKFTIDRPGNPQRGVLLKGSVTEVFEPVTASEFRLVFSNLSTPDKDAQIAEIGLSNVWKIERYIEKQLGQMFPWFQAPWDAFVWDRVPDSDKQAFLQPDKILNISDSMDAEGNLSWVAPEGRWTILRLGMSPTNARNNSAPKEGQGLEIDKMSRKQVKDFFPTYVGKILASLSPEERKSWKYVILDSYEKGPQNWTEGLLKEFKDRYGYDPLPWLPVMTGVVVGTPDQSDRFLWDLRRLVADKVAEDYAGTFRELCHENGLKLWMEPYGHFGFPGEDLKYGGRADIPAGEFWTGGMLGSFELRIAASSGHIYGKPIISAEAFTSGRPSWKHSPWTLKQRSDWAMAEGINQFTLHLYIHQPDERSPGINAWFGTEFNRNNTWFNYMDGWIDSLRRTQAVLQQGQPVADLLYFTGEDAPKETGILDPALPDGFNYDFINGEVIRTRLTVRDGRFVLPDGTGYALLVLPPLETMRPEMLKTIIGLVEQGGAILGNPPQFSPSMENYPACDDEVRQLASKLWNGIDGETVTAGRYGKGCVFRGVGADAALAALGVDPDIKGIGPRPAITSKQGLAWIHRRNGSEDAYFLANQGDETLNVSPTFHVSGRYPELWNTVTGEMAALSDFTEKDGTIQIPLQFGPRESWIVVFRELSKVPPERSERGLAIVRQRPQEVATTGNAANFPSFEPLMSLDGRWNVLFDPALKGPGNVQFDKLSDWTKNSDARIQYYSGTATYQADFKMGSIPNGALFLNLGGYESIARVRLNGKDLGVIWTQPGRIEITDAVQAGNNHLEIDVSNTWNNRVLGDSKLPEAERITWTSVDNGIKPTTQLMPSGLLGPVQIERRMQ